MLQFARHVTLTSLTFSSVDSDSNLATQRVHCLEWPTFTSTSQQLLQVRPPFPIAVCSAAHASFTAKLSHAAVALYGSLLCSIRTVVL